MILLKNVSTIQFFALFDLSLTTTMQKKGSSQGEQLMTSF